MHLTDLLDAEVFDASGARVGKVHDVRMVQDGPLLETWGAAFRVDGLVVGKRSVGTRLGFDRHDMRGPWLVKLAFARGQPPLLVPWDRIAEIGDHRITITGTPDDLEPLPEARQ